MSKKVLIIGAAGKVGRMLRRVWPAGEPALWQARHGADLRWDLADGVAALVANLATVDAVICLAGATGAEFDLNLHIAEAVVTAAAQAGTVKRVFLASTMAVYGRPVGGLLAEDDGCAPLGDYGRSKLRMERQAADLADALGVPVSSLRLANVVGADMLFGNIAAGEPIMLHRFADGGFPRRSYIDPLRLAQALAGLVGLVRAGTELPSVLNLASGPPLGMAELLDAAGVGYKVEAAPKAALAEVAMDLGRLNALLPATALPCGAAEAVANWQKARVQG